VAARNDLDALDELPIELLARTEVAEASAVSRRMTGAHLGIALGLLVLRLPILSGRRQRRRCWFTRRERPCPPQAMTGAPCDSDKYDYCESQVVGMRICTCYPHEKMWRCY
jgi:hypothetical protein